MKARRSMAIEALEDRRLFSVFTFGAAPGVAFEGKIGFIDTGAALGYAPPSMTINWGDGTPASQAHIDPVNNGLIEIYGTHTYAAAGNYDVTVAYENVAAFPLSAAEVAMPTPASANVIEAAAGSEFIEDLGEIPALPAAPQSVSIDWGDGSAPSTGGYFSLGNGQADITGYHTYANAGNYVVSVNAVDSAGVTSVIAQFPANIRANITYGPPPASINTFEFQAGVARSPSGDVIAFYPAAGTAPTSVTIDWGDGTPSSAGSYSESISEAAPGASSQPEAEIFGVHTYASAGNYTITVTGLDGSNATPTTLAVSTAQVSAPPAGAGATSSTKAMVNTFGFQAGVAPLSDFDGDAVAFYSAPTIAPQAVTIDWGDGTPTSAGAYVVTQDSGGSFANAVVIGGAGIAVITGTHTYATPGNYTITVTGVEGSNPTPTVLAVSTADVTAPPASTGAPSSNSATQQPVATNVEVSTEPVAFTFSDTPPTGGLIIWPTTVAVPQPVTTGVTGVALTETWTATLPPALAATPKVIIHWGDGTSSVGQITVTAGQATVEASHTYRKHGKYRAVAVFHEHGKIIDRVTDVLTIEKANPK